MDFLRELARQLFDRRHEAISVPFRDCSNPAFEPVWQDCHTNVDRWCRSHAEHQPARGWLVFEAHSQPEFCRFIAHTVVADKQGQLFDSTPTCASRRYPFLRDELVEEEYLLMLSARQLVHVDHRPQRPAAILGPALVVVAA